MMKVAFVIAGMLVLTVIVVLAVGAMLPKAHVARRVAHYNKRPEAVWKVITDYGAFPTWRKQVQSVEAMAPVNGQPAWRERGPDGSIPFEVVEAKQQQRLVTRIADPKLPFGGTWTYDLVPESGGTALTITENGEVYNPVFRFVSKYIMGHTAGIDDYLRSLGRKFGEVTVPQEAGGGWRRD